MSVRSDKNNFPSSLERSDRLLRHATFRQLQIFESIYRLGSFTRAAEELFLTQPTVSMQLKKLSDTVQMPLFEHVGRHVEPTEAGQELYEATRKVFDILVNVEMKLSDLQGMKRGRLRLAVITTAKYLVPEMLGEFSKQFPGIDLALKVTNRERNLERMHANEDDLYIMGQLPDSDFDLVTYKFAPNPLVAMAPRNHPLVGQKNISLERLAEENFIMREPGSGIRDAIFKLFRDKKLTPRVRMELGSNEAIKHAIVGELGISIMSLHTLTLDGSNGPVALLDVEGLPLMRDWFLVHPRSKELSLAAQEFLSFANECTHKIKKKMLENWPLLEGNIDI